MLKKRQYPVKNLSYIQQTQKPTIKPHLLQLPLFLLQLTAGEILKSFLFIYFVSNKRDSGGDNQKSNIFWEVPP